MSEENAPDPKRALVKRAPRDMRGRFQKGHKLATGRPKGAKNRATLVREKMEQDGTLMLGRIFPHLVKKALEMAMDGDRELLKEFLARGMPKNRTEKEGVPDRIEVVINNLIANKRDIKADIVDAEIVNDETPRLEHQPAEDVSVIINTRGRESVRRN